MPAMKNLYKEIHLRLSEVGDIPKDGNTIKRINTLSGLVNGMIRKGSSHLPDIGSGLCKNMDANSKTIAAKRFVENKWIDFESYYLPYLIPFLHGILLCSRLGKGIVLVIDGSQTGKDNATLMISLVWQNRGIPICWLTKKGSKGHFKSSDHESVMTYAIKILKPLLPEKFPVALLGDGEFDGIGLQKLCLSNGWDYVLRTANNTVFYDGGERFRAKTVSPDPSTDCVFIPSLDFTEERFPNVNFVCWHDHEKHEKPIFLVSNLDCPKEIMEFYDQRYSIECLFKDIKSTSFNIHKTRLKKTGEVFNLIIIAAVAFLLLTAIAIKYDEPKWRKKVQRIRKDRKVLSFFTFAYRLIHFFIDNDVGFNFSFQFSKNYK